MRIYTDFEIRQGSGEGLFQISAEGGVYRRRPGGPIDDYGCYGRLLPELNTDEHRSALLAILRNTVNGSGRKGANRKQTEQIVREYNEKHGGK